MIIQTESGRTTQRMIDQRKQTLFMDKIIDDSKWIRRPYAEVNQEQKFMAIPFFFRISHYFVRSKKEIMSDIVQLKMGLCKEPNE